MSKEETFIDLRITCNKELGITSVQFIENTTKLPYNSDTIKSVAWAILKSLNANKEDVHIQDVLSEFEITKCKHPRSERTYIGNNELKCRLCGETFN